MKNLIVNGAKAILFGCAIFMLPSCSKSSDPTSKGEAEFQVADAPSDDPSIKSVFVTVTDVKVDGNSMSGFAKQTIDLKAYQNGNTRLLADGQLTAKSYSNVTLVLDADTDASGTSPGCYVQTTDNTKYKLGSGAINLTAVENWRLPANIKSTIILDFDLRKTIKSESDQSVRYNFVSQDNLQTAVRVVPKANSGTVNGTYSEQFVTHADKIIVYVYKKDAFNATTEAQGQTSDEIFFKNAVTSAEVTGSTFMVPFLEEGTYELHFAAYKKDSVSNTFTFQNLLSAQLTINGSVGDAITITDGASINVVTVITGSI